VVVVAEREDCSYRKQQQVGYGSQEGGMFWIMPTTSAALSLRLPACATASLSKCGARFFCNAEAEKLWPIRKAM